jgi:hypothetical protein
LFVLSIPLKTPEIINMLMELGTGIFDGAGGVVESLGIAIPDIVELIISVFKFSVKYASCAFEFLVNFKSCFVVHIISAIKLMCYLIFFYVPAKIIVIITGFDILPAIDGMFQMIDSADDSFSQFAGFNLTKPSDRMTTKCYSCNGRIISSNDFLTDLNVFTDLGAKFGYDFGTAIPPKMQPLVDHWGKAYQSLQSVLTPIF